VLNYAYTNNTLGNNLRGEGIEIESPIVNGPTDGQGNEKVYYNTTTNKYEYYMDLLPVSGNDVVVTLTGMTLAGNIDYYLSITDTKRIIFNGDLLIGDVINVFYNTDVTNQGEIDYLSFTVSWSITTPPQTTDGLFTIEFSNDVDFNNILTTSATSQYVVGQVGYSKEIGLSGSLGDIQYYRIKNEKKYISICGDELSSVAYSDTVDITIQTNAFNSY
jgi:hypothetical protein